MTQARLLRALIVAEIALTALALPFGFVDDRFLPLPLQAYTRAESESPLRLQEVLFLMLALPVLTTLVVAWIGLLRWWRAAPALYLAACAGNVVLLLMGGPTVQSALFTAADTASSMLSGVILGLVYFSALRERFGRNAPIAEVH